MSERRTAFASGRCFYGSVRPAVEATGGVFEGRMGDVGHSLISYVCVLWVGRNLGFMESEAARCQLDIVRGSLGELVCQGEWVSDEMCPRRP